MQRLASTRSTVGISGDCGGGGGGGAGEEGEERLGNFEFHALGEEEDEEDMNQEARVKSFRLLPGGLGSPKAAGTGRKKGGGGAGGGGLKSDVDIYNIINEEEKDGGRRRRKGLALGQAIAHSMQTSLFNETTGSKATKHPPAAFAHTKATDVTFQDVTFSFQEFAPVIFLSIREHFGIDNAAYLQSMADLRGGQVGNTFMHVYIMSFITLPPPTPKTVD